LNSFSVYNTDISS